MKCPKCDSEQADGATECQRCGLIFAKYRSDPEREFHDISGSDKPAGNLPASSAHDLDQRVFPSDEDALNPLYFGGRVIAFLIILILGIKYMFSPLDSPDLSDSVMHLINLPFHEAGHVFFRPFGQFITTLGGTLGQLIMPAVCMAVFIIKSRDYFGSAVCLWWIGENFLDIAPYINDADKLVMPLLGGNTGETSPYGFHDWEYILTESGLIHHAHTIAVSALILGDAIMTASFIWAAHRLYRQYMQIKRGRP
jgi:hypothetical protein